MAAFARCKENLDTLETEWEITSILYLEKEGNLKVWIYSDMERYSNLSLHICVCLFLNNLKMVQQPLVIQKLTFRSSLSFVFF